MLLVLLERWLVRWPDLGMLGSLARITPRAGLAALASFVLALVCGPRLIRWLRARYREPIKSASPDVARLHEPKRATPTMGGIFIVGGLVGGTLVFGDLSNAYLPLTLCVVVALAALGAVDDVIKLSTSARGVRARTKLIAQTVIALAAALAVYRLQTHLDGNSELLVPLVGRAIAPVWLFVPLATLVIVGSSNAVNLADGLDGLAGGCLLSATAALALVVYASGHAEWAAYLNIPHVGGAGELSIVAASTLGAVLGFLWFNCHPASVFMGDTGSLPLGGLLGLMAVIARQEFVLLLIGGVFVVEVASVIAQVAWFRWTKTRIFRCAPMHHHFQLQGWPEGKVVVRFWIAGALCAIVGLAALKLHAGQTPSSPQITAAQRLTR